MTACETMNNDKLTINCVFMAYPLACYKILLLSNHLEKLSPDACEHFSVAVSNGVKTIEGSILAGHVVYSRWVRLAPRWLRV